MTITYPLSKAGFFEAIRAWTPDFDLIDYQSISGTKGGDVIAREIAASKWAATLDLPPENNTDASATTALIHSLRGVKGTFLAYDTRHAYPTADPDGSILGASTPQINAADTSAATLAIKGLPAAYVITRGDYISVAYAGGFIALHQCLETVTANGSGVTSSFAAAPTILPGIAVNDAVTLIKAPAIFRILPGTRQPASGKGATISGASLRMIQVLK